MRFGRARASHPESCSRRPEPQPESSRSLPEKSLWTHRCCLKRREQVATSLLHLVVVASASFAESKRTAARQKSLARNFALSSSSSSLLSAIPGSYADQDLDQPSDVCLHRTPRSPSQKTHLSRPLAPAHHRVPQSNRTSAQPTAKSEGHSHDTSMLLETPHSSLLRGAG
jgi:hypothetical protein